MKNSSPHSPLPIINKRSNGLINWTEQWEQFAPNFKDGKAHIDLSRFGTKQTLLLQPGPGFGDLSHPTTSLMLSLMGSEVLGKVVLDIGCGSGILSLAALLMGSQRAIGIDIDEGALLHAEQNAKLNGCQSRTHFSKTLPKKSKGIVLINMILSEQREVLRAIPNLATKSSLWITSGILQTQRNEALFLTNRLGLELVDEKEDGEWLGMKFKPKLLKNLS